MLTTLLSGRAFAEKFGAASPTVVALHGWGRDRHDWASTLAGRDALALDLPGFGATPAPAEGWDPARYAEWLAEILADLDRPVLLGHSFGGRVAIHLGAAHPELTRGLVLTEVPLLRSEPSGGGKPALAYRVGRWAHRRGLVSEQRMEKLRRTHGSADYRNAEGVMREVLVRSVNEDYSEQLRAVSGHTLPVAMVWGEHDTAATVAMAERARDLLGERADLEVVAGSAHLLDPSLVAALRAATDRLLEGAS